MGRVTNDTITKNGDKVGTLKAIDFFLSFTPVEEMSEKSLIQKLDIRNELSKYGVKLN